ncbi:MULTISPECIES: cytochrome aa3 quinol oxidase subunit II [unclassified Sporosarcina]|uniref:cytochrome aa3 quinol oxidase subunit II n=1 Tax=unclassified Sporosarcina TaxID=2647733 RepID=UPI00203D36A6|nr:MULTISPECIES: cytochrome aa3 quinol oxidase subunit II [unclassified Sporosarcina]GKV64706.1 quinol oxidase subunit 2 [Sporosarcina sp. NCCP-2331]GLB54816.1 quinol oxidase subunit 2 [Sporosarcina sp. NCCP-2378]
MKKKWLLFSSFLILVLSGCDNPLLIFDPKGPQAKTISDTILFSILMMAGILFVVYVLFTFMLVKYRASKMDEKYEPPHEEGSKWLEITWIAIPVIIVVILSVVTVRSTTDVESTPKAYANETPLIVYASSSNWKWHFSYPEEGIETVNYVNIPEDRPIEFRLYSYGPISSFWIPQLAGQKYAMSDMVTKIHLAADTPGSYMGKNSNFSGKDFAHMEFEAQVLTEKDFDEWVQDVKETAPALTEQEFNHLLEPGVLGRKTYKSTHLEFSPAPEGKHAGHQHGGDMEMEMDMTHESESDMQGEDHHN